MTERSVVLGTNFRIYVDGVDLADMVGFECNWRGMDLGEPVEPRLDHNAGSIEIHGEGRYPSKHLRRFLFEPPPKTHPKSPRESLRRR